MVPVTNVKPKRRLGKFPRFLARARQKTRVLVNARCKAIEVILLVCDKIDHFFLGSFKI